MDSVSNYKPYFNTLNLNGQDFIDGMKINNIHKFETINTNLFFILFVNYVIKTTKKCSHSPIHIENQS